MVFRLSLVPERPSYRPGDVVRASLEVWNDAPPFAGAINVAGITLQLVGLERVDHTWVSSSYAVDIPPVDRDARRETRHIFRIPPERLGKERMIAAGERLQWSCMIRLPDHVPPSFKGVAVRYSYHFHVSARYNDPGPSGSGSSSRLSSRALSGEHGRDGHVSPTPSEQSFSSMAPSMGQPPQGIARPQSLSSFLFRGGLASAPAEKPLAPAESYAWQEVNIRVPLHLWLTRDITDRRRVNGVQAGDDAEMPIISYTLPGPAAAAATPAGPLTASQAASALLNGEDHFEPRWICQEVNDFFQGPGQNSRTWLANLAQKGFTVDRVPGPGQSTGPAVGLGQSNNGSRNDTPRSNMSHREDDAFGQFGRRPSGTLSNSGDNWGANSDSRLSTMMSCNSPSAPLDTSLRSYNLRVGSHTLVRLALHGPLDGIVELGATLAGTLDFRAGHQGSSPPGPAGVPPRCVQVVVSLETEEAIQEQYQATAGVRKNAGPIRKVYDEQQEVTQDLVLSHFMFSVPYEAPPSFATKLVSLRWLLRFEFTAAHSKPASGWLTSAPQLPERITWALPFIVRPPDR